MAASSNRLQSSLFPAGGIQDSSSDDCQPFHVDRSPERTVKSGLDEFVALLGLDLRRVSEDWQTTVDGDAGAVGEGHEGLAKTDGATGLDTVHVLRGEG